MKKYLSSLLLMLVPIIWGLSFSAQKDAAALSAFTIGSIRGLFATVFLLLAIPLLDKFTKNGRRLVSRGKFLDFNRHELIGGVCCGAVLAVAGALQQLGIGEGSDAGKAAFISALYVVIVPIIYLFFRKNAPINVWVGVAVSVFGFYLLCIKDGFTVMFSDLLVLISALVFALHITVIDKFTPHCDGVRLSCVQFFVAFVINTVCTLIFDSPLDLELIKVNLPSLAYLGIFSSGIAYTLQIIGQKNTPPAVASTILSLESVFGALGAAILHGERMTGREYIGCAVVFLAVMIAQLDVAAIKKKFTKKPKIDN